MFPITTIVKTQYDRASYNILSNDHLTTGFPFYSYLDMTSFPLIIAKERF